jgi:hypothetical protein
MKLGSEIQIAQFSTLRKDFWFFDEALEILLL